jgi:uncharacterized protein (DUF924 family)
MTDGWQAIHEFWFGTAASDPRRAEARGAFWFGASPDTDAEVRDRFLPEVLAAVRGERAIWLESPRSALSLVIALDQFPRNIWRGSARAFEQDAEALRVAQACLARGHLPELSPVEQGFLVMPFQHVESVELQRESVRLYRGIVANAPEQWRPVAANFEKFAQLHLELIERFGRFPHRNAILGRPSTLEEAAYLASGSENFGQRTS